MKTVDKYVFNALDNYPYNLELTSESLSYALSYDSSNTMALCLMGRMYAEQLFDYESAKSYFTEALSYNIYAIEIYPHYIQTCIWNEDYTEAKKLIDFALTIKGTRKAEIIWKQVQLLERTNAFKEAKKKLKAFQMLCCDHDHDKIIEDTKARLDEKINQSKK